MLRSARLVCVAAPLHPTRPSRADRAGLYCVRRTLQRTVDPTTMKSIGALAHLRKHAPWTLLTLAAGLLVSGGAAWHTWRADQFAVSSAIEREANRVADAALSRVSLYQYGLHGLAATVHAFGIDRMTQRQFRDYVSARNLAVEFPGARGFGLVRRVPEHEEGRFEDRVRADQRPEFNVHALGTHSGERMIVQYIEPTAANLGGSGLDIASEQHRREAAQAATLRGEVQLTAPINLVQDLGTSRQSFLMLLPLYQGPTVPASIEQRQASAVGWTYTALVISEVLQGLSVDDRLLHLQFSDITTPGESVAFYTGPRPLADARGSASFSIDRQVFGRVWRLEFTAYPAFVNSVRQTSPWLVLGLGTLASLLLAVVVQLIKDGRRRQRTVIAQQARLAAIVESSGDAIVGLDLQGILTSWNRGAEQIFGYSVGQALGWHWHSLVDAGGEADTLAADLQRVAKGEVVSGLQTVRCPGASRPLQVALTLSPIRAANGHVTGVSMTVRDVSEQKAAEAKIIHLNQNLEVQVAERTAELTASNTLLEGILAAASEVAIVATDLDGTIRVFNAGAQSMLGYTAEEMIGLQTPQVYHDHDELAALNARLSERHGRALDGMRGFIANAAELGPAQQYSCHLVRKNGDRFPVQLVVSAIRNPAGQPTGFLGIAIDVTAQHQLQKSLEQAKNEADAANRAKSAFLANMSHEIRTPMNAVLGMLHLVMQTELSVGQHDFLTKAQSAARLLLGLLNDILDYSKIEAGKLLIEHLPFDLDLLLQDLAVVLAGNQTNEAVEVIFDIDPQIPVHLLGDRLRLQQILINLAGNALKFTSTGQIVLQVGVLQRSESRISLRFAVIDSGIGISPDQLRRIFEGFTQAEASIARRFGGTGLGLLICRRLTRLMGSELQVESDLHKGSRFWFDLDLTLGEQSAERREQPARLNVLVVDDNPVCGEIFLRTLQGLGWQAHHVHSAGQAFAALRERFAAQQPYDVVLMDWRMPGMDGLQAARVLRQRADLQPAPPVVMITAYGREILAQEEPQGSRAFAGLLTKPVTVSQLSQALIDALRGVPMLSNSARVLPRAGIKRLAGLRLLLVEDNKVNQLVASALLQAEGARVEVAVGGVEGVQAVMTATVPFDAVLMDVQMPDIDGFEATRRIRRHIRFDSLPIIAMTANVSEEDQRACFAAGMDEHVGKPIDVERLVSILLDFL
jgi:PAS domain S-box-containing protein